MCLPERDIFKSARQRLASTETNPLFINGSENATIHGNYISNILWNSDLLTGENILEKKRFSKWYKNDLQFETAVLKWKEHLK